MSPSLNNEDLVALDQAFRAVCVELGLGANADDNNRRERLSQIIVSIANEGERDPAAIARRAFDLMKLSEPMV
jgi:hypothetical protein